MANLYHSMAGPGMMNGWFGGLGFWIWPIIIWSIIWKGLALWKASRLGSKPWFVVLLLVNTAGILEILYLYIFSKKVAPVKEEK